MNPDAWATGSAVGLLVVLLPALIYRWILALVVLVRGPVRVEPGSADHRFLVVIPAHDESSTIASSVEGILAADYPPRLLNVIVIADNCVDGTARVAREHGAQVLERDRPDDPGKGQAIAWGLDHLDLDTADALVFLDADCRISANFFQAASARLSAGARIIQANNAPSNPDESALTRLMAITSVMKNLLFYQGKEILGLSAHLMGTGMVFHSSVLRRHGWSSRSVGEDLEQSLALIGAGERVSFIGHATVFAQEAASLRQGYSQRRRWASGRIGLARSACKAVLTGLRERRPMLIDAGMELLIPTYSMALNLTLLMGLLGLAAGPDSHVPALALAALAGQALEAIAALWLMRPSWRFVLALGFSPLFLAWKLGIDLMTLLGRRPKTWVRTARSASQGPSSEA